MSAVIPVAASAVPAIPAVPVATAVPAATATAMPAAAAVWSAGAAMNLAVLRLGRREQLCGEHERQQTDQLETSRMSVSRHDGLPRKRR